MNSIAKISFLGDIALNDDYILLKKDKKKPFKEVSSFLKDSNYVIGNLECMLQGKDGENELKIPRLKTTLETFNYLNEINLNCALLAHNHIYDNLVDGYIKTIDFLNKNQIDSLGAGLSRKEACQPLIKTINDLEFCFLNYVTLDTNPKLPNDSKIYLNELEKDNVLNDIKKYRKNCDYIILLFHWGGGHEGGNFPEMYQSVLAKRFIDKGADLIIGNHSHTFQPYEIYKGKYIFYSLGNFCFSNIDEFQYEINQNRATKSIILTIHFSKNNYSIDIKPIKNNNSYIENDNKLLYEYDKRQKIFSLMKNSKFLWISYHYYHKYLFPIYYYFLGNNRNPIDRLKKIKLKKIKFYFLRK